jgi:hypothetical protein
MRARITAGLVLAAEAGHLVAAYEEADAWPLLSGCHVIFAAVYGLLSAALLRRPPGRRAVRTATSMALTLPLLWLGTRTLGLPTYLTFTQLEVTPAGIGTTLVEVALVAALLTGPDARAVPSLAGRGDGRRGPR